MDIEWILSEDYKKYKEKRNKLLSFYLIKRYLPKKLIKKIRKKRTKIIAGNSQPDIEYLLSPIPWLQDKKCTFVVTHDVEGNTGLKNIDKFVRLEMDLGIRSSFNFVPHNYNITPNLVKNLSKEGFEIGVHGLKHDGLLFLSKIIFDRRIDKIRKYKEKWGASGFRSPSTVRNVEWIKKLPFLYDSSFPDWEPLEPIPGGCRTIYPFMIGNVVELPITLMQDHHMFVYLGENDNRIWKEKFDWIRHHNGLALMIVHPDYITEETLAIYKDFLEYALSFSDVWHTIPKNVAQWYKSHFYSKK